MMNRLIFALCACFGSVGPARADDVLVFAAASLKEPLDQIAQDFGGVVVSYGSSGLLARQVMQGAPADVILLANADWMQALQDADAVRPESIATFASNTLVLIGQPQTDSVSLTADAILEALDGGHMAVGLTRSVPAGIYARQALMALGMWDTLAPHLAEVDNVRAALALVSRGEAPLGIVYATDARVAPDLSVLARFDGSTHDPITYTGAVTTISVHAKASDFMDYIASPPAQKILSVAGFGSTETVQ